jgi:hypothetical protein
MDTGEYSICREISGFVKSNNIQGRAWYLNEERKVRE